jgi:hypothetical protein
MLWSGKMLLAAIESFVQRRDGTKFMTDVVAVSNLGNLSDAFDRGSATRYGIYFGIFHARSSLVALCPSRRAIHESRHPQGQPGEQPSTSI